MSDPPIADHGWIARSNYGEIVIPFDKSNDQCKGCVCADCDKDSCSGCQKHYLEGACGLCADGSDKSRLWYYAGHPTAEDDA